MFTSRFKPSYCNGWTYGINNAREISHSIVFVGSAALGRTPAIGEAAVRIVLVKEQKIVVCVKFVCHTAKLIVYPGGCLILAVGQCEQITRAVVGVRIGGHAHRNDT